MFDNLLSNLTFAFREAPEAAIPASGGVDMGTISILVIIALAILVT